MENHRFRENISDKSLRQFFNTKNNTPNKRYKTDDYIRLRREYHVLLDVNKQRQRIKKNTGNKNQREAKLFLSQFGNVIPEPRTRVKSKPRMKISKLEKYVRVRTFSLSLPGVSKALYIQLTKRV